MGTMANMVAAQQQPFNLQQAAQDYARQAVYGNKTLAGMEGQSMLPAYRAMMGGNRALQLAQLDTSGAQNVGEGVLKGLDNVIRLGQASSMRRQQEEDQQGLAAMMQAEAQRREEMMAEYERAAQSQYQNSYRAAAAVLPQGTKPEVIAAVAQNPELAKSLFTGTTIKSAETTTAAQTGATNFLNALQSIVVTDAQGNKIPAGKMALSNDPQQASIGRSFLKAYGIDFVAPEGVQQAQETGKQATITTAMKENELGVQPTKLAQEVTSANLDIQKKEQDITKGNLELASLPEKLKTELDTARFNLQKAQTADERERIIQAQRVNLVNTLSENGKNPNWYQDANKVQVYNTAMATLKGESIKPAEATPGQYFRGSDNKVYMYQKGKNGVINQVEVDETKLPPGVVGPAVEIPVNEPLGQTGDAAIKLTPRKQTQRDKNAQQINAKLGKTFEDLVAAPGRKLINSQAIFGSQREAEMFIKRNNLKDAKPREQKGADGTSFGWKIY